MSRNKAKILWADNDLGQIYPFKRALEAEGFLVFSTRSASEAERIFQRESPDLTILDVMIPTIGEAEERIYSRAETNRGLRTGLLLFKRLKDRLSGHQQIMVLSVRVDEEIQREFEEAGLAPQNFLTKLELRRTERFIKAVRDRLNQPGSKGGS